MQLSKVEFLNNLRLRLLLPPSNTTRLGTILQCACGAKDLVAGMDDHHALDCPLSSGTRSIRHTLVVDAVFDFLRRCFPAAETRKEFSIPGASGRGSVVDICFIAGHFTFYIDIAVVNPGASVYRNLGSAEFAGVAAKKRSKDKKSLYQRHDLHNIFVIPFVIEAGGRWG